MQTQLQFLRSSVFWHLMSASYQNCRVSDQFCRESGFLSDNGHATIQHLPGLDHLGLTYQYSGGIYRGLSGHFSMSISHCNGTL
ncbi:MAG TPA: hypothetical protein DCG12_19345 [Planctomycetaceae bacterium]|nr:hypothetical protein [Planctomycetaceae bacterium]